MKHRTWLLVACLGLMMPLRAFALPDAALRLPDCTSGGAAAGRADGACAAPTLQWNRALNVSLANALADDVPAPADTAPAPAEPSFAQQAKQASHDALRFTEKAAWITGAVGLAIAWDLWGELDSAKSDQAQVNDDKKSTKADKRHAREEVQHTDQALGIANYVWIGAFAVAIVAHFSANALEDKAGPSSGKGTLSYDVMPSLLPHQPSRVQVSYSW